MGASCSCSNCIGFPQDLDLEKEKKINKDFFLDYNDEDMTQDNKPIKIKNTPTNLTSNNNDLPLYTTKSYSNINNINNTNNNNINVPIFGNESYNKMFNQIMNQNDNSKDKEIFIRENNSKVMFINPANESKEIVINDKDYNKDGFIINESDNNRQIFRIVDSNNEVIINSEDNNKGAFINVEDKEKEIVYNIDNKDDVSSEDGQKDEGNFINMDDNNKFKRASDSENELIIKDENDDENNISISNQIEVDTSEMKNSKVELKIKPKKIALSHNINNNINKYSIGSVNSAGNRNSNISKQEVIYSVSSEIIGKKKYGNENITEEEYNAKPNDEYSRIIFDNINKLRRNPKYIANMIDENKKYIILEKIILNLV